MERINKRTYNAYRKAGIVLTVKKKKRAKIGLGARTLRDTRGDKGVLS